MVALCNHLAYAVRHAGLACVAMSLLGKVWHVLCRNAECFADDNVVLLRHLHANACWAITAHIVASISLPSLLYGVVNACLSMPTANAMFNPVSE
jgi:hypothetical protein